MIDIMQKLYTDICIYIILDQIHAKIDKLVSVHACKSKLKWSAKSIEIYIYASHGQQNKTTKPCMHVHLSAMQNLISKMII